jgi:hypothetical protein
MTNLVDEGVSDDASRLDIEARTSDQPLTLAAFDRIVGRSDRRATISLIILACSLRVILMGFSLVQLTLTTGINETEVTENSTRLHFQFRLFLERLTFGDPGWYLDIAIRGYTDEPFTTSGFRNWGFFPAWPIAIRLIDFILPVGAVVSSIILANILSIVAFTVLYKLLRLDYSPALAFSSVSLLILSPGAFHLARPGSEALFLLLVVTTFYAARHRLHLVAGLLGGLACLTRPNGIIILPALATLALIQLRSRGETMSRPVNWFKLSWLALVPMGLLGFMLYLKQLTGNIMAYFDQKRVNWGWRNEFPYAHLIAWLRSPRLTGDYGWDLAVLSAPLLIALTVAVVLGIIRRSEVRLPPEYWVYVVLSVVMLAARNSVSGVSRYTLAAFPVFVLVVLLLQRRLGILAWVGLAFLAAQTSLFLLSQESLPWAN